MVFLDELIAEIPGSMCFYRRINPPSSQGKSWGFCVSCRLEGYILLDSRILGGGFKDCWFQFSAFCHTYLLKMSILTTPWYMVVQGLYKPIHGDCAIYLRPGVICFPLGWINYIMVNWATKKGPWMVWVIFRGWNTTRLYRDYYEPWHKDPGSTKQDFPRKVVRPVFFLWHKNWWSWFESEVYFFLRGTVALWLGHPFHFSGIPTQSKPPMNHERWNPDMP